LKIGSVRSKKLRISEKCHRQFREVKNGKFSRFVALLWRKERHAIGTVEALKQLCRGAYVGFTRRGLF
jgi:hypothetical protein